MWSSLHKYINNQQNCERQLSLLACVAGAKRGGEGAEKGKKKEKGRERLL